MTDKKSPHNHNPFGENTYEDEMFEREDGDQNSRIITPTQKIDDKIKAKGSSTQIMNNYNGKHQNQYQIPIDEDNASRHSKSQKSSVPQQERSQRQINQNSYNEEHEQQQSHPQMQQQSQQINMTINNNNNTQMINNRSGSAAAIQNDLSYSQSQSNNNDTFKPTPIRGGDFSQNRPQTVNDGITTNSPFIQNVNEYGNPNGDYGGVAGQRIEGLGSGMRFGQSKGSFQGGIPDLKANTMGGYSAQRPTTQGGVGLNFGNQFNQTHFQTNPHSYDEFRTMSNPNMNSGKKVQQKPPMSYTSQKASQESHIRGRRQFITQILQNQNNSATDVQINGQDGLKNVSPMRNFNTKEPSSTQSNGLMQLNRKKIRELLYGGSASRAVGQVGGGNGFQNTSQVANYIEKEQLQNEKRNLKLQMNSMKDELLKMKTKVQIQNQEMAKKEKDVEILTLKLQQIQMGQPQTVSQKAEGNIFESFLVSQLKKQNRELRSDLDRKDQEIEKLKRDLKLSKATEMEIEMQQYVDECMRLRGMLESFMQQNPHTYQNQLHNQSQLAQQVISSSPTQDQQQQQQPDQQQMLQNMQNFQQSFALREQQYMDQFQQLQQALLNAQQQITYEQDLRSQLQLQLMAEKEQKDKNEQKFIQQEQRMKKFNQIMEENKRKQKIIEDKNKEVSKLKEESEQFRAKALERDHIHNKNKELVTKYYGQQSSVTEKDKKIKELQEKLSELQNVGSLSKTQSMTNNRKTNNSTSNQSPERRSIPQKYQFTTQNINKQDDSGKQNSLIKQIKPSNNQINNSNIISVINQTPKEQFNSVQIGDQAEKQIINTAQTANKADTPLQQPPNKLPNLLDYTPNQFELLFRAIKSQSLLVASDPPGFRNYYNQHKDEIQKEINHIFSLDLHDQLKEHLSYDPDVYSQVANNLPKKIGVFSELENQIQSNLRIEDKDLKRYLIFHKILKNSETYSEPNYQKLQDLFKNLAKREKPSVNSSDKNPINSQPVSHQNTSQAHKLDKRDQVNQLQQQQQQQQHSSNKPSEDGQVNVDVSMPPSTVRVNENIQESNAQFQPPQMELQNKDNRASDKSNSNKGQTHYQGADQEQANQNYKNEEEYEQDDFEDDPNSQNITMLNKQQYRDADTDQPQLKLTDNINNQSINGGEGADGMEEQQLSIQITEDHMLDLAEQVFAKLADCLKKANLTIRSVFGKYIRIVDQYEGEKEVLVIMQADFLGVLRKIIGKEELSDLEEACLMRVLSKPEIDHCIVVSELQLVMENFGILNSNNDSGTQQQDPNDSSNNNITTNNVNNSMAEMKEQAEQRKNKQTKKKQIKDAIWKGKDSDVDSSVDGGELIYQIFNQLIKAIEGGIPTIIQLIKIKAYEQLVKSKKKELKMELISKPDFLGMIEQAAQLQVSENQALSNALSWMVQIDAKYPDVLQVKMIQAMLQEVEARSAKEEQEAKTLQEFYKPSVENVDEEGASGNNGAVEVLNFDQLINEDDDEEYNQYLDQDDQNNTNVAGGVNTNPKHKPTKSSNLMPIVEDQLNEDTQSPAKH